MYHTHTHTHAHTYTHTHTHRESTIWEVSKVKYSTVQARETTCTALYMWQSCLEIEYYMWQSRVEIERYSVAYFDRITALETRYLWTSVKGGAQTRYVSIVAAFTQRIWVPSLTEVQRYHVSNAETRSKYDVRFLLGTATYSIAYYMYNHITAFKAPYLWTSVKGGAQTCCANAATINATTYASYMSPTLKWKFRDIVFLTKWLDQNTQRNVFFPPGTVTHTYCYQAHVVIYTHAAMVKCVRAVN